MIRNIPKTSLQIKIAFGYKMGVGKDEACSYLTNKYGGEKISFATPIYDIQRYAQLRCGFSNEKDRQFLQYIGTEWARKKDPDVWIRLAINDSPKEGNVFLSDLRFQNEFHSLKKEGWFCVKIDRSLVDIEERKGTGTIFHESETSLDSLKESDWDYIIQNNETIENFYKSLDILYLKIWRNNVNKLL
jgi:hypothetical protein